MSVDLNELPSALFFNPQSKPFTADYLASIRLYLHSTPELQPLLHTIEALTETWELICKQRDEFSSLVQGPSSIQALAAWLMGEKYTENIPNAMSGCSALPLLTIVQSCQYLQFLQVKGIRHEQLLRVLSKGGGVHGYCAGLLPAIAVAISSNEKELIENVCKSLRIALAVGAYADIGDDYTSEQPTNIVLRLKCEGQGEDIISRFPGTHISAITDPRTISLVGPGEILSKVTAYTKTLGLLSQGVHIRGRVHSPENNDLAKELHAFCDRHSDLRYSDASKPRVTIRSNLTGEALSMESLTHEVISTILCHQCNWFSLLKYVSADLANSGRREHMVMNFGIGDCLSLVPFLQNDLQISKLDAVALTKLQRQSVSSADHSYPQDAVAVVGMACRFPGANSTEELWELLMSGKSTVTELPEARVDASQCYRLLTDKGSLKKGFYGNFIDHPDSFDNEFFGISAREALSMDPQQRLLLETAYQAVESAGYLRDSNRGDPVGVFVGASTVEYLVNSSSHPPTAYTSMGTLRAFLCGRISHFFGWTGPAEVLDTACSSSLVAINRAIKAIQHGECSMALAGGVNVISSMENYLDLGKAGFLSPTGQCKPFDQAADGYCRSEGVGLVLLKPLKAAIEAKDAIIGVVSGSATNQGGQSSSITVPHSPSQIRLYKGLLRQAGLSSSQVSYVEAHGTGTQAGDPLEVASICEVFGGRERDDILSLGSIKGNIGHAETAAGVAGFIKGLLLLTKGQIPRLASHNTLNPKIPALEPQRMSIAKSNQPWDTPFRAVCVNSYGAAGSNAAVLLTQAPKPAAQRLNQPIASCQSYPFILSAASADDLQASTAELKNYLQAMGSRNTLAQVAYTLGEKRAHHKYRRVTVQAEMSGLVKSLDDEFPPKDAVPRNPKPLVLVFPGQSRQFVGLQKQLYDSCPLLQSHINHCDDLLKEMGFFPILPTIFETEPLTSIQALQCGIFALQYACARAWIDSGLEIAAVVGHSLGELTALTVAGVLSLADGLKIVATRAALIERRWGSEKGGMLAVRGSEDSSQAIIDGLSTEALEVACYNGDKAQVLVGSGASIENAEQYTSQNKAMRSVQTQRLSVSHGFHSRLTEPILEELDEVAKSVTFGPPKIPVECCTLGHQDGIFSEHIAKHTRKPVFFVHAIGRLEERLGPCRWLEAGTGSSVIPMVKRAVSNPNNHSFHILDPGKHDDPLKPLCELTADLWRDGVEVSFWNFRKPLDLDLRHIWLPPYHFQRKRHWLPIVDHTTKALKERGTNDSSGGVDPSLEAKPQPLVTGLPEPKSNDGKERFIINTGNDRYTSIVAGHAVLQRPLCPAAMYMECVFVAIYLSQETIASKAYSFEGCLFQSLLGIDSNRKVTISTIAEKQKDRWSFTVESSPKGDKPSKSSVHAQGKLKLTQDLDIHHTQRLIMRQIANLREDTSLEFIRGAKVYSLFSRVVIYAPYFQGITSFKISDSEALAEVTIPKDTETMPDTAVSVCDARSLDIFLQVCGLLLNTHASCGPEEVFLASGIDHVVCDASSSFKAGGQWTVYTTFTSMSDNVAKGDVWVLQDSEKLTVSMLGVNFTKIPVKVLARLLDASSPTPAPISKATNINPVTSAKSSSNLSEMTASSSSESSADIGTPYTEISEENVKALQRLLASFTGLSKDKVLPTTRVAEMGVDSLAAIELADEINSQFGVTITSDDLLEGDFQALCAALSPASDINGRSDPESSRKSSSEPTSSTPKSKTQDSEQRQKLMVIISTLSGCAVAQIRDDSTLQDLGVDSLAKIELKSEIEDAFGQNINDEDLATDTDMKTILKLLRILPQPDAETYEAASIPEAWPESDSPPKSESPSENPNPFPEVDPVAALSRCNATFDESAKKFGFLGYLNTAGPKQDELLLAYIAEAFRDLGSDLYQARPDEAISEIRHRPEHKKLMQRLWAILEHFGIVYQSDSGLRRSHKALPTSAASTLSDRFIAGFPKYAYDANLMAVTGPKLAACLTGEANPLALLFGNPQAKKILGDFYQHSPMFATLTDHLVNFVKRLLAEPGRGGFKILEVGAGFGGTTTALAEALQKIGNIRYTFTDVSPTLVDQARKSFAKYSWMDFQTLDLEKEPPSTLQNKYDMIIATNVVHATSNLVRSCTTMRALLRSGGFICLSEITRPIDWFDIVFGLLSGWWAFNDGRKYALQTAEDWMRDFNKAGFASTHYSCSSSAESLSQQLLLGMTKLSKVAEASPSTDSRLKARYSVETLVYKIVDETSIAADVYLPGEQGNKGSMPIALLIHGGGFMTLSRKAIRLKQVEHLLDNGVLPISIDYRLCPEINIVEGPMTDVRDAVIWARETLPAITGTLGIHVDPSRIVVVGWSTGGHLAMTTAWTVPTAGHQPPTAILNFYGPSNFEALSSSTDLGVELPERSMSMKEIVRALPKKPITNYDPAGRGDSTSLGWVRPGDPRSELVLSLFKERNGLDHLLYGLSTHENSERHPPTEEEVAAISPITQVMRGNYDVPTFSVHGDKDEIVPCDMSIQFELALQAKGVKSGILVVKGAWHIHDLATRPGTESWEEGVGPGYRFLFDVLGMGGNS